LALDIRHFPMDASARRSIWPLKKRVVDFVEPDGASMRGIIVESVSAEELQAVRCVHAVEGYLDLGMFEEAEAELRELDPGWFGSERILSLQLRVLAGLGECQ
jgi:hypothetical protein